ncbi:ABC transporter permease [Aminipila luticellarii]|uniref:ABC transporter permease n=1 Tax=Aminipila luticellarii TaxID=2507160 RepID=A0A410PXK4_9FIRM|nr:ABC transporter permease [Aminipila luticellarii]QAT43681.1 ABC transporter permease [Aminipila luticellarii]
MNKLFYVNMAWSNMKKNSRMYLPFCLASTGTIAMFYMLEAIAESNGLSMIRGGETLRAILNFGCFIIGMFACIFLFYTNNFLMKQRKKELGIYNVLGMGKRHIGIILFFETILLYGINIVTGLISGAVISKFIFLILLKMMDCEIPIAFSVEKKAVATAIVLFGLIFFAMLLSNIRQIRLAKPVELLQSANAGEKEPKTKGLLAIAGVITLGAGYGIALTIQSPLSALTLFFVAVILVIIGTYALFTAGSIAVLKLLRRNKNYYYKTKHFIGTSGMIYRMKKNAVGLANICILSTMVLVTLSTTVCLYSGQSRVVESAYPRDVQIIAHDVAVNTKSQIFDIIQKSQSEGIKQAKNMTVFNYYTYDSVRDGSRFSGQDKSSGERAYELIFMTLADYNSAERSDWKLAEDEVLVYSDGIYNEDSLDVLDHQFRVKSQLENFPFENISMSENSKKVYVILSDQKIFDQVQQKINETYSFEGRLRCYSGFDYQENAEEGKAFLEKIKKNIEEQNMNAYVATKADMEQDSMAVFGGLLFVGGFLGVLFIMATVLIIYYKQVSEGYEDRMRFQIMQKVGLTPKEVRASIKSQMLTVFFLPLLVAIIHVAGAFNMITKMLALFRLTDIHLFLTCTLVTVVIFGIIYGIVYGLTAKAYYKIVR